MTLPHTKTLFRTLCLLMAIALVLILSAAVVVDDFISVARGGMLSTREAVFRLFVELQEYALVHVADYLFFLGLLLSIMVLHDRRRPVLRTVAIIFSILWVVYSRPLAAFLRPLGVDSFSEVFGFELGEAFFYLGTIRDIIEPDISLVIFFFYLLLSVLVLLLFGGVKRLFRTTGAGIENVTMILSTLLIVSGAYLQFAEPLSLFMEASHSYQQIVENFSNEPPPIQRQGDGPHVVVYIGESMSVMNAGIYGYHRETTPGLQSLLENEQNLLVFDRVFSTHTHTARSLLEALSLGLDAREQSLPIAQRKRVSVVDVLRSGGIRSVLISNQGQSGTWNQASSIIFGGAERVFSTRSALAGNRDYVFAKPYDHRYFSETLLPILDSWDEPEPGVLFFHSYAGHGPYLENIPAEYRKPVDASMAEAPPHSVYGFTRDTGKIDAYDSAIRYVDDTLCRAFAALNRRTDPVVLVYFSDHGDSAYTNRGHDSSRFVHEMARIPFLVYFNDAAIESYPDRYARFRSLAEQSHVSTLAHLPQTLFELLGVKVDPLLPGQSRPVGAAGDAAIDPIVVRKTTSGTTFIDLNGSSNHSNSLQGDAVDVTDDATLVFTIADLNTSQATQVCYHRTNTLGKALRGSLVADCLEFDLVVQDDGEMSIHHPPAEPTGFRLAQILDLARKSERGLWIDAKNIDQGDLCHALVDSLEGYDDVGQGSLVEFPSGVDFNNPELQACSQRLGDLGFRRSLYVPTSAVVGCADDVMQDGPQVVSRRCHDLENILFKAFQSEMFTDVSFDYRGRVAMETLPSGNGLRWNTWGVTARSFEEIVPERFGKVVLRNNDPNNR